MSTARRTPMQNPSSFALMTCIQRSCRLSIAVHQGEPRPRHPAYEYRPTRPLDAVAATQLPSIPFLQRKAGSMATNGKNGHADGNLKSDLERWESTTLKKALERGGERQPEFATTSTETRRLYTPLDTADLDYDRDLGYPGEFPYTRGVQATMYRGRLWTMRQYAGFGTAQGVERALQVPARARARPASPSPSTCRRRSASTPTTRTPTPRSDRSASPSTRSPTWRRCSTASRSTASARR